MTEPDNLIEQCIQRWLAGHPERDLPNRALCTIEHARHPITKREIDSQAIVKLCNGNGVLTVYKVKNLDKKKQVYVYEELHQTGWE